MSLIISDKATRDAIEAYTDKNTFPDIIRFIEDKNGEWFTSDECLVDIKYSRTPAINDELVKAVSKTITPKDVAAIDIPIDTKPLTDGTEEKAL